MIRKNPFEFQPATVVVNGSVTRDVITRKQERAFPEFVKGDKHFSRYCNGIYILYILFKTRGANSEQQNETGAP